jgi:hypothetical protein
MLGWLLAGVGAIAALVALLHHQRRRHGRSHLPD